VTGYSPSMQDLRDSIDSELESFLAARREAIPESADLIAEIHRLISAGGKRLRPSFCYWGFRAGGGMDCPEIARAAASLELLHTFAIVHDDIMDDSDERRGEPTSHIRHGLGFALLVGDLALVLADELFVNAGFSPDVVMRAWSGYSVMRQEVIAGQCLDVLNARRLEISEPEARRVAVLKSGRYSIEKPLVIGGLLATAGDEFVNAISEFGDPLGEAFQLRDDLLGVFGDRDTIGKPVDSDIREGKRNVLFAATARLLQGETRSFFIDRWGGESLNHEEIERLRSLIDDSGARAAAESMLWDCRQTSDRALAGMAIPDDARAALEDLADQATQRDI
jgi:geranylgeranyl diphosphate synthase, type I